MSTPHRKNSDTPEGSLPVSDVAHRLLFEANPHPMWVIDRETLAFLAVNQAAVERYGYSREEFLSLTLRDVRPPQDIPRFLEAVRNFVSDKGFRSAGRWRHQKKDGTLIDVEVTAHTLMFGGRPASLAILNDITERRKIEESLRQLSGRLLQIQDEERRRIARELHDSTAQILAGLAMNLTSANDCATALDPKVRKVLSDSLALAEQCAREIRTLSYLLHPPLLDEVGLVSALRWYTKGFAERSGIRVDFEVFPELGRLPPETEAALFRVVQECLSNALRHSGSPTARVRIDRKPTEIVLEVRDEGKGMDPEALERARGDFNTMGVGIAGMRERLRQLGGRLEIDSGKGGTAVKAILLIQRGNL